jgi:hypothetical protein
MLVGKQCSRLSYECFLLSENVWQLGSIVGLLLALMDGFLSLEILVLDDDEEEFSSVVVMIGLTGVSSLKGF